MVQKNNQVTQCDCVCLLLLAYEYVCEKKGLRQGTGAESYVECVALLDANLGEFSDAGLGVQRWKMKEWFHE